MILERWWVERPAQYLNVMMYVVLSNHVKTKSGDRKRKRQEKKRENARTPTGGRAGNHPVPTSPKKQKVFFYYHGWPARRAHPTWHRSDIVSLTISFLSSQRIQLNSNLYNTIPIHSIDVHTNRQNCLWWFINLSSRSSSRTLNISVHTNPATDNSLAAWLT